MDDRRTSRAWARHLGVAPGTVLNWTEKGLAFDVVSNRRMIGRDDLRSFLLGRPDLGKADQALQRLADPTPGNDSAGSGAEDDRPLLRGLRARVATLAEELARTQAELERAVRDRDLWRARAKAHRDTLRGQLDLEEQADAQS